MERRLRRHSGLYRGQCPLGSAGRGHAHIDGRLSLDLYSEDKAEQKFWQGVRQSPARTTRDIRSRFREIDRRLADMETFYVSNNKQLAD